MSVNKKIKEPRDFPSVEEIIQKMQERLTPGYLPRPYLTEIVRDAIEKEKKKITGDKYELTEKALLDKIQKEAMNRKRGEVARVINATGIIVHTNLGRAPLSEALFEAIKSTVTGYGNIEFDIREGVRGKRGEVCEKYLSLLAGSEAGTVVNNCAGALFISLNTLANRKKVLISRGELVQIGGGFRIPDILRKSGAKLNEVGTTNITTLADYEKNLDEQTSLILKVHKSNFVQGGFTEEVPLKKLVELGRKHDLPVLNDLGSGVFIPTREILGYEEFSVQQSVHAGANLTCFSGDKLLGGVQAGLIVGSAELIAKIKKNPIFRTLRVDKIVFSMLERLLSIYLNGTHLQDIKLWSLVSVPEAELYKRGKKMLSNLGQPKGISLEATKSFIGGGALPEAAIPSVGLVFSREYNPNQMLKAFRDNAPPIIGRIENDQFILDLKAIDEGDLEAVTQAVKKNIR